MSETDRILRIRHLSKKRAVLHEIKNLILSHELTLNDTLKEIETSLAMVHQELDSLGWKEPGSPPPSLL